MRRLFGLITGIFVWMAAVPIVHAQEDRKEAITFVLVSETRQTAEGSLSALQGLTQAIKRMETPPAFLIHTGNLTDTGRPEEYARIQEGLRGLGNTPIYALPGSRDLRWNPGGKRAFLTAIESLPTDKDEKKPGRGTPVRLYRSFDNGPAHFILLDSTVPLQPWGHLDTAQLTWLKRDLEKVKADRPILIFLHHPVAQEGPNTRPIPNEFEFWPMLRGRNVMALFTGPGKTEKVFQRNGVTVVSENGLTRNVYHRVNVTPLKVTIDRLEIGDENKPTTVASLPVNRRARPSTLSAGLDDANIPYLVRRHPVALLDPRAVTDNPENEKAEYRIGDDPWKPMTRDLRDNWRSPFRTEKLPVGVLTTTVRLTTGSGMVHEAELIFDVERGDNEPTQRWAVNLDGPIQSSPTLDRDTLYVSSTDGKVTAMNTEKGKKRWAFSAKEPFLASPTLSNGTVYIGGMDGVLYALNAENGSVRWRFETDSPFYATAAVARNVVCVGGSGRIYGIDTETGKPKWTQTTGGFFQSRCATDGQTFYLGGWDNTLYAVDSQAGTIKWRAQMGYNAQEQLAFPLSPAVSSPAVGGDRVFVCSGDGLLHAFDARTGQELWSRRAPEGGAAFGVSSPVVVGPTLIVAGTGGTDTAGQGDVYALEPSSGNVLWKTRVGQAIADSSPKVSPDGESLAIIGLRGHVAVLNTRSGSPLWSFELGPGNVFSTPEYDGRTVYTVTMANDVQALNGPGIGVLPPRKPRVRTEK